MLDERLCESLFAAPMYPHQSGYLKLARCHQRNGPRQRQWIIIKEKTGFKKTSESCRMIGYCIFCRTERMAAEKMDDIGSEKWFPSQSLCPSHPSLITKILWDRDADTASRSWPIPDIYTIFRVHFSSFIAFGIRTVSGAGGRCLPSEQSGSIRLKNQEILPAKLSLAECPLLAGSCRSKPLDERLLWV